MVDQVARSKAKRRRAQQRRQRLLVFGGLILVIAVMAGLLSLLFQSGNSQEKDPNVAASGQVKPSPTEPDPPSQSSSQEETEPETEPGPTYSAEEKMEIIHTSPDYPQELVEFADKYAEALDYVFYYPERKDERPVIDLSAEAASGEIPLLIQWDRRWGYLPYGDAFIGDAGCGPTCVSMAAIYLTKNPNITPYVVADYSYSHHHRVSGSGTSWTLISEGSEDLRMRAEQLPLDENTIKMHLDAGRPIIVSVGPGDFTSAGHYILLTGYDSDGFTIHDPNSPQNSAKHWTFERLSGQILNLWAMSALG